MLRRLPWLIVVAAVSASASDETVLNVYNWADYVAPDTIERFQREFQIRVNYDTYDATEIAEARLLAGSTGYDVVVHAARYSARLIPIGVYRKLERKRLTRYTNLDPWVLEQFRATDPDLAYGVPYMWGTTGLAYNEEMVFERMPDAPVSSGDLIFKPEIVARFADCGVTFLDEPTEVIPLALGYLGYSVNSTDREQLAEVEALLKAVRPYIRYFSSARMIRDLPSEEVCIAMSWSGDYAQAAARAAESGRDVSLAYAVPREIVLGWFDGLYIPADAPHPESAHTFINFLLRPEIIAAISRETGYANPNQASRPFMDRAVLNDPAAYPPREQLANMVVSRIFSPEIERQRTRLWARFKAGL